MATNPATLQDIVNRWRPLTTVESVVAATLLDDAWTLLTHRDATIKPRLDAIPATLDVALVRMVLVEMVKRVLRNPDGIRQESAQDYSVTRDSSSSGQLVVLDEELDLLVGATVGAGDAFTIRPAWQVPVGTNGHVPAKWEWV